MPSSGSTPGVGTQAGGPTLAQVRHPCGGKPELLAGLEALGVIDPEPPDARQSLL